MLLVLLSVAAAIFYYRIGDHDYGAGFVTAGLSILVSVITWFVLDWGRFGFLGGQVLLFAAMTWYNGERQKKRAASLSADRPVPTSYPPTDTTDGA